MRDLLSVRIAVTALSTGLNTTTEQNSVTKWNPVILFLYGFFNIRNCANSVMAKRTRHVG